MSEEKTEWIAPLAGGGTVTYDASEQDILLDVFRTMLGSVTKDGGRKRAAGTKPPWYIDQSHEAAIFSHLSKWKHGEIADPDSGTHPLIHLAWRSLAVAYQEIYGKRQPLGVWSPEEKHYLHEIQS